MGLKSITKRANDETPSGSSGSRMRDATLLIVSLGLLYQLLRRKKFAPSVSLMGVILVCVGIICGLTMIGVWFRGPGMTLGLHF